MARKGGPRTRGGQLHKIDTIIRNAAYSAQMTEKDLSTGLARRPEWANKSRSAIYYLWYKRLLLVRSLILEHETRERKRAQRMVTTMNRLRGRLDQSGHNWNNVTGCGRPKLKNSGLLRVEMDESIRDIDELGRLLNEDRRSTDEVVQ